MKKIFSILLTGSILVMTTSSKTSAQRIRNSSYSESNFENVRNPLGSSHRSVMSAKAVRDFSKTFKKAVDTKWYETPNGSIVYFFYDGIKMKSAYDKKGRWVHTLSFYDEFKLPKDVRHMIKRSYYDYIINQVVQVDRNNERIFIVMMHDATSFKTVRVCSDEMEIVADFKKAFASLSDIHHTGGF